MSRSRTGGPETGPRSSHADAADAARPARDRRGRIVSRASSFAGDERGAAAVELGLVGGFFIMLLLGAIDFGNALWQYNQASKAIQLGVRLASVSDPVSSDLATFDGTSAGAQPGDPMPYFERHCSGATSPPRCTGGTFDAGALQSIVYGRGNTSCPATTGNHTAMCQIFPRIRPENIEVDYVQSGIGLAGISGIRPTPTITLRLVNLNYEFMLLGDLLGLPDIPMGGLLATATAEDLSGR
jgi:Flp pilus assembly pilin Flp